LVCYFCLPNETVMFSPIAAVPHIFTGLPDCNTMPSEKTAGNLTWAEVCKARKHKQTKSDRFNKEG